MSGGKESGTMGHLERMIMAGGMTGYQQVPLRHALMGPKTSAGEGAEGMSPEAARRARAESREIDEGAASSASEGDEGAGPGQHRAGQRGSSEGRDKAVERSRVFEDRG